MQSVISYIKEFWVRLWNPEDEVDASPADEDEVDASPAGEDEVEEAPSVRLKTITDILTLSTKQGVKKFSGSLDAFFTPEEQLAMIWLIYRCEGSSMCTMRERLFNMICCPGSLYMWIYREYRNYDHRNLPPSNVLKRMKQFKSCLEEVGLYCRGVDNINYGELPLEELRNPEIENSYRGQRERREKVVDMISDKLFFSSRNMQKFSL